MNPFPPAHPQLPAAPRPLGAVTLTPDLQAATQALVMRLAQGCVSTTFDECSAFQQAYVNAGGSISIDGLYGQQTQRALQSVLTTLDGSTAPAACVGSAVPVLAPTAPAPAPSGPMALLAPGATVNVPFVGAVQTRTLFVGAAALLATWLVGSALWRKAQEGGLGVQHAPARVRHSQMPTRPHRRRNPARRRRVREKARVRAESQIRDEKSGRFRKG